MQVQETQRVPIRMNSDRSTARHIIIKMAKLKTENLRQQGRNS